MTKVNIREALNQIDKDTDCKYDLVTLYEGHNFNDEQKKEIAKMISDNEDAEVIYDRLSDKFGEDVDFDDDDISDIALHECDMTTDTEEYFDFDDLDEDTIKTSKGKWVNKGKEGTHGTFDTKKEADAQRKAMFASGWKGESLKEDMDLTEVKNIINVLNKKLRVHFEHNAGGVFFFNRTPFNKDTFNKLIENNYKIIGDILKEQGFKYDISENAYISKDKNLYVTIYGNTDNIIVHFEEVESESLKESLEGEDGWSEEIVEICEPFFTSVEKIAYEIRNNVRGAHHTGTTVEWLIEVFNQFSIDAEDIIEELRENRDTLTEASYGGAYDIADDEYFTKEDGMEAANEVIERLNDHFANATYDVTDIDLNNDHFKVTIIDSKGTEFSEELPIDMRKIRHPLDLVKKYSPVLAEKFKLSIVDYYSDFDENHKYIDMSSWG